MRPMPFCGTCRLGLDFQNDSDMMRVRIVKRGLAVHLSQHLVDKIRSIAEKYEIQKSYYLVPVLVRITELEVISI